MTQTGPQEELNRSEHFKVQMNLNFSAVLERPLDPI